MGSCLNQIIKVITLSMTRTKQNPTGREGGREGGK